MSAHVTSYLDAIAHLPSGATLTLTNVSWEEYEQLLQDLGKGSAVRVFYDHGWLEIVSPTGRHERSKDLIAYLVRAIADELEKDLESFGSTTFKEKELESGGEPDTCFYLQTAARVNRPLLDCDVVGGACASPQAEAAVYCPGARLRRKRLPLTVFPSLVHRPAP